MDKIEVKCSICNSSIFVAKSTYVRKHTSWKCRKCLAQESKTHYQNLSKEEKERRAKISSNNMKSVWSKMNSSEKESRLDKLNNGYKIYEENKSTKDKLKESEIKCKRMKDIWKNLSNEERDKRILPMHEGQKKWYDALSDEEKINFHKYIQDGNKKWWNSLSDNDKEKFSKIRSESSKLFWDNITEEEKKIISERQSKIASLYWENMTPNEYEEWNKKRALGLTNYVNNLSNMINKNESDMANILKLYNLKYEIHWYNKQEHPDFHKLFLKNPVTNSTFVSPIHQWDFMVETLDGKVLIDIDGSIHNPDKINHEIRYFNGIKINIKDLISFNDSKRQYQTDNLLAYIIQCYDDNLQDSTPVINLITKEKINMKNLCHILSVMNMTKKEKRSLLK